MRSNSSSKLRRWLKIDVSLSSPRSDARMLTFISGDKFRRIRENELYEDDLYFVSQMYEKEWTPRDTVIDFGDETVVGVPLKQFGSPPRA